MKKLLLIGACVASMALSTSALAAVTYGETTEFALSFKDKNDAATTADIASVSIANKTGETNLPTEGQLSVVIVKGDGFSVADGSTVKKANFNLADILFIDQGAPSDFNGKYMGLMIKDASGNTLDKLPAGNYTVMIGSDKTAAIQAVKFTVGADKKTVAYGNLDGDVDNDGNAIIDSTDVGILAKYVVDLVTGFTDPEGKAMPIQIGNLDGDVDDDGNAIIDSTDVGILAKYVVDLVTGFTDPQGNALTTLEY